MSNAGFVGVLHCSFIVDFNFMEKDNSLDFSIVFGKGTVVCAGVRLF